MSEKGFDPKVLDVPPRDDGGMAASMTLRDYFAGQALRELSHYSDLSDRGVAGVAKIAYELADAMIAERLKS